MDFEREQAVSELGQVLARLAARGATAVRLSCTELPVYWGDLEVSARNFVVVDATEALAAGLHEARGGCHRPGRHDVAYDAEHGAHSTAVLSSRQRQTTTPPVTQTPAGARGENLIGSCLACVFLRF